MVVTHDTSVAQTPSLLGRARGPLRLRIVEDAHSSEQVVTLSAAKCTVGSDQRCTLRLDLPGIESVYCLILRGKRCDVVRSWAGHTLLNGRPFQDARLNSGDLLRLGTVNVEVLPDTEIDRHPDDEHQAAIEPGVVDPAEAALSKSTVATIPNPVNEQLVIELLATRQEINELPDQVQTSEDELRRAVEESERRAEHREEWETERQSWRQQQAEWDAEREGWEVQQLEWQDRESDWNEQRCQVEQQADEWFRQKESWENQHSEWQQRQSEWEAERAEWERRIQLLEEGQATVSDESPISDPDSGDWDQEEKDQVSQQIQQRLQAQRDALDREKAVAQADEVNAESLADDQIAKLERPAALLAEHLTTRGKDNHDESIEDYMARLLQRVSDDDDDSPAVSAPSTGIESVPTSAAPISAVENTIPEPIQAEPGPQLEYVPRAQAPEQAGTLEAMREVANMSARSAINTHTRMRGGKASHLRLAVALIAMVVGGVLQWMSSTTNPGFGQVGLAIIVLGIFWGCQAMLISRACLSDTQRPDAGIAGAGTGNDDNGNLFTDEG